MWVAQAINWKRIYLLLTTQRPQLCVILATVTMRNLMTLTTFTLWAHRFHKDNKELLSYLGKIAARDRAGTEF